MGPVLESSFSGFLGILHGFKKGVGERAFELAFVRWFSMAFEGFLWLFYVFSMGLEVFERFSWFPIVFHVFSGCFFYDLRRVFQ